MRVAKESSGFKLFVVLGVGAALAGVLYARGRLASGGSQPSTPNANANASANATVTATTSATTSASTSASTSGTSSPSDDRTALALAVIEGDLAKLDALHQRGVPLTDILTPAVRAGHAPVISWLIDHGVDVHEDENTATPPLLIAEDNEAIALLLLGRGVEEPSLLKAIRARAPKTVARILSKKADPNVVDETGTPALTVAIAALDGPVRMTIVKALLDAGAKVDAKPDAGTEPESALSVAVREAAVGSDGAVEIVKLLATKATVDPTAMSTALAMHSPQRDAVLDALLAGKVPPETAYRGVSVATDPKLVARIAAKGVAWKTKDPLATDAPLVNAVQRLEPELVRVLLAAGAPIDVADESGETALLAAVSAGAPESEDAAKIVTLLLAKGANPNQKAKDGRRPLFVAAGRGSEPVVKALLTKGARVDADVAGITPLEAAEEGGHEEIVKLLLAKGARKKTAPKN